MQSHILPFDQKHHQEELKNNLTISKSHHDSYSKNKAEVSEWSYHGAKGFRLVLKS